jgi:hypothetical protein
VRALARSPFAIVVSALWGYAEATRFWLVPDIVLAWVALNRSRFTIPSVAAATLGAIVGGARMHQHARAEQERLTEIPGINKAMLADAHAKFAARGWVAVIRAPLDGIPYKVYATESALAGRRLDELVAWTPIARLWRFLLTAAGAMAVGVAFGTSVRRSQKHWLAAAAAFWTVLYVRYFARLRRRYGAPT